MSEKKVVGRPFKKGESGNPKGPGVLPPEVRKIRALTHEEIRVVGEMILLHTVEELSEIAKDPKTDALKAWIISVTLKSIDRGDMASLNALLDRLVGKVVSKVEVQGSLHSQLVAIMGSKDAGSIEGS